MGRVLTIGGLAKAAETKVETVRWYEKVGLLDAPSRTEGNYRAYRPQDMSRLIFIRRARELGFSLDGVRALLDLTNEPTRECDSVDRLAGEHLAAIDRKIADLGALRRELAALLTSCRGGAVSECRIIEAFGRAPVPRRKPERQAPLPPDASRP